VDPAVLQDLAISSLRCPQRPCPRQNLGQPGLLANVDGYQDGGGKIPRQIPHDLDQWLHTPGRPADRPDQWMIWPGFGLIDSHQLRESESGRRLCMIVVSIRENSLSILRQ